MAAAVDRFSSVPLFELDELIASEPGLPSAPLKLSAMVEMENAACSATVSAARNTINSSKGRRATSQLVERPRGEDGSKHFARVVHTVPLAQLQQSLLSSGISPEEVEQVTECSRLAWAVRRIHGQKTKGLSIDAPVDADGNTLLAYFAANGHAPAVFALLLGGASAEAAHQPNGVTPLMHATRECLHTCNPFQALNCKHDRIKSLLMAKNDMRQPALQMHPYQK
jgi:hypothetical protein